MRAGDPDPRLDFWRDALRTAGAVPRRPQDAGGFETWDLPETRDLPEIRDLPETRDLPEIRDLP
jgi:hypothetical protein